MIKEEDILAIVGSELSLTQGTGQDGWPDLQTSLDAYLGNPNGKEVEGKSQVTSTDVADAIEWIMPQIMRAFTMNNEVVVFDPVHEGDEEQAEIESEYVYEVIMKQNEGFILLHTMIKDALMQRNGILKVFYEKEVTEFTNDYTGITDNEFNAIVSQPNVEVLSHSAGEDTLAMIDFKQAMDEFKKKFDQFQQMPPEKQRELMQQMPPEAMQPPQPPPPLHDIKVKYTNQNGKVVIVAVPQEEFRYTSDHNSISLEKCRFTAHVFQATNTELREYGVSQEMLEEMPEDNSYTDREYRFQLQGETVFYGDYTEDPSMNLKEVAECNMLIDLEGDGIASLWKILVAGGDTPTHVLHKEKINMMPWVTTTAILMSHKFQGLSIYDRLREIQEQKTALWRNMFDNLYLQNNQRVEVVEGQVNLDDLMVNRSGGIVRVKRIGAINPLVTPQIGDSAYTMMNYLDKVAAGRTGVSAEGGTAPQDIGDRVGSQGLQELMNAKQELVGLIIRVIAETGVKPLMRKVRDLCTYHQDAIVDFRFRGKWVKINPKTWQNRTNCTVRVGAGTGDHNDQIAALRELGAYQERIHQMPSQPLVDMQGSFNIIDQFCKLSGLNGANQYFIDPSSPKGQQKAEEIGKKEAEEKKKNDEMQMMMAQSQMDLAQAEMEKAKAQTTNVQLKAQIETVKNQLTMQKQMSDAEISVLSSQLEEAELTLNTAGKGEELQFKYDQLDTNKNLKMTELELKYNQDQQDNLRADAELIDQLEEDDNDSGTTGTT